MCNVVGHIPQQISKIVYSVAITSECMMESERFEEIGTHGKSNFITIILGMIFQFLEEIIIY